MHEDSQSHCLEYPPVIMFTVYPVTLQIENVFDDTLHLFYFKKALEVELLMFLFLHDLEHLFAIRRIIHDLHAIGVQIDFAFTFNV